MATVNYWEAKSDKHVVRVQRNPNYPDPPFGQAADFGMLDK